MLPAPMPPLVLLTCYVPTQKKGFGYSLLSEPKRKLIAPLTGSASSTIRR